MLTRGQSETVYSLFCVVCLLIFDLQTVDLGAVKWSAYLESREIFNQIIAFLMGEIYFSILIKWCNIVYCTSLHKPKTLCPGVPPVPAGGEAELATGPLVLPETRGQPAQPQQPGRRSLHPEAPPWRLWVRLLVISILLFILLMILPYIQCLCKPNWGRPH